MALQIDKL